MAVLTGCPEEYSISMQEGQYAQTQCDGHTHTAGCKETEHGNY